MLLNNEWVDSEIKEEIKKFLEISQNEHATAQDLCDTVETVLRGKYIAIQAYLKKVEKSQINNITLYVQGLEEQQQIKPRASRRK